LTTITEELRARTNELAAVQEATKIGRRSESTWFGKPTIGLPAHHQQTVDTTQLFPPQLEPLLKKKEEMITDDVNNTGEDNGTPCTSKRHGSCEP